MTAPVIDTSEIDALISKVARWRTRLIGAIGVLVVAGLSAAAMPFLFRKKLEHLAWLGGYTAGTVGVVWALAAMLAVLLTFLAQQEQIAQQTIELLLTREELRLQRETLAEQRREMETQTATFRRQQFESTYFELLRAHADVLARVRVERGLQQVAVVGAEAMGLIFNQLKATVVSMVGAQKAVNDVSGAVAAYQEVYRGREALLGPYYRSLYQLVKYVDDEKQSFIDRDERRRYVNFARARLSSSELQLLFYNGLSPEGEGMKPLMEKYSLLKHLPYNILINPQHASAYPISVFRRQPAP